MLDQSRTVDSFEAEKVTQPRLAQSKAESLFHEVKTRALIRPASRKAAGHLIGHFPHERIAEDKVSLYVHPKNNLRMRSMDEHGQQRHWILEIHFVDKKRQIGGFFEELLSVG